MLYLIDWRLYSSGSLLYTSKHPLPQLLILDELGVGLSDHEQVVHLFFINRITWYQTISQRIETWKRNCDIMGGFYPT